MDSPMKRFLFYISACLAFVVLLLLRPTDWDFIPLLHQAAPSLSTIAEATIANSTLGFGAVVAVSHAKSPRQKDLLYAANLTGITITIPAQPVWTDEDLRSFRSPEKSRISKGSALAWMGHLNALRWFLDSPLETALVLEDDVDWDIRLRTTQIPLAAATIRQLLGNSSTLDYWGSLTWEILYLGHCGDMLKPSRLETLAHQTYEDTTLPPTERLHSRTSKLLLDLGIPEHTRLAHRSYFPLCTFGYAVTRASAQKILDSYNKEGENGCQAFDVRILEACRDHDWKCYTINPELFHHIDAPSEIANVDKGKVEEGEEKLKRLKGTQNLACGARQQGFVVEGEEGKGWLRREVGEKGMCLMDLMEEDMGRWP
ncbi:hypothetical protein GQ43DRAFT_404931 [Delitschia confertaspora ATCC 74209]|uniref:LPS glycosyltransferase n=1 Tax=Delitschia confertaspora ATCC 74209 TaxID=1513339 RepID=A0A9P4MTW6_9PLEO|nr:hypothetical protein GQ43DRAFT_404931 [Delitschia confertaspora ATCC 74209]